MKGTADGNQKGRLYKRSSPPVEETAQEISRANFFQTVFKPLKFFPTDLIARE